MKVKSFQDLTVWQEAHKLTLEVYKMTGKFPASEKYGIVSQLRRCGSSVPANIAEGFGRATTRELLRCLQISRRELEETRYFILLSRDLGYVAPKDCEDIGQRCDSIGRLINALGSSLKQRLTSGRVTPVTSHQSLVTSHGVPCA
jgi:four helix bundle protein